ncbi:MAG: hypothetical protein H2069_01050 [Legionella sp.]|nr:hypothetical protein [Legionella sp.]
MNQELRNTLTMILTLGLTAAAMGASTSIQEDTNLRTHQNALSNPQAENLRYYPYYGYGLIDPKSSTAKIIGIVLGSITGALIVCAALCKLRSSYQNRQVQNRLRTTNPVVPQGEGQVQEGDNAAPVNNNNVEVELAQQINMQNPVAHAPEAIHLQNEEPRVGNFGIFQDNRAQTNTNPNEAQETVNINRYAI